MKCWIILGLALPAVAHAATLRVPEDYPTVLAGVDAAAFGDTVLVAPGTYSDTERRRIPWSGGTRSIRSLAFPRDGVVLLAEGGPDVTTLDFTAPLEYGDWFALAVSGASSGVTIEGFHVDGGGRRRRGAIALDRESGDVTVRNCRIVSFNSSEYGSSVLKHDGSGATIRIEGCEIVNARGQPASALRLYDHDVEILDTRVEGCLATAVDLIASPLSGRTVRVVDCEFVGNRSALLVRAGFVDVSVRNCRFQGNTSGAGVGAVPEGAGVVEGCLFLENEAGLGTSGPVSIEGNTFWGNGRAVSLPAESRLNRNVVANSSGSSAISAGSVDASTSGCNVLWNNQRDWSPRADGPDTLAIGQRVDPEFCDAEGGDFRVAASSPCVPGNLYPECTKVIGAFGIGCPDTGRSVVGFRTLPDVISLRIDGVEIPTPRLLSWEVGTLHEIGTVASPFEPVPGTRYWFRSWTDGGAETHEVAAPDTFVEYVASFSVEHFLSASADTGGTVSASEWVAEGETREILATPAPGFIFDRWVGAGDGSYSGGANPATVTLNGPIQQRAQFLALFLPLEMSAGEGGTVTPESGPRPRETSVPIEAFPDEGWAFSHWIGTGQGSYSGSLNPASVFLYEPISQTAVFVDADPLLTMDVVGGGWVSPETAPQFIFTQVEIEATPALGWEFDRWHGFGDGSYTGRNNPAVVTMNEPLYQTARFIIGELPLTVLAEEGGTVTPESGPVTSFTEVEIEAAASPGYRFVQWKGEGDGSYTGTDNPATVTLDGPITQVASFEPSAFSATLSLSDTDPYAHTGAAIGLGNVHLWVTCGTTEHGLRSVRLNAAGSLEPLAFLPAPGVAASGTGSVLASIDGCPDGPVRLGSFLVNSPGEGSLCLDVTGALPGLTITDCEGTVYSWPENVGFVGVHTGGGAPCGGGSGCEAIDSFSAPVGAPDVSAAPSVTRLAGIFPNPFGEGTTIEFEVARAMEVRLSVFDVGGRQVRVLREGSVPAGRHAVGWDGRDSGGRAVSAGVYFVRLTGDGLEQTEKVTVVRGRP